MIGERRLERRGQLKGITGRNEVGLVSVGQHFGDAVDIGADNSRAKHHRLQEHSRK